MGSPSFAELSALNKEGKLSAEQAEIFIEPRPSEELYLISNDKNQFNNLAFTEKYKEKQMELKQILLEWMDETGDNIPEKLTADWYEKVPGYIKTPENGIRGEMPGKANSSTKNNNKGKF